ncbi:MAG: hypothetical protein ACOCRX_10860 [Candidatus Woesearchaeota archaeon]
MKSRYVVKEKIGNLEFKEIKRLSKQQVKDLKRNGIKVKKIIDKH